MKLIFKSLLIILIFNIDLKADTPFFEIITIKYNKKIYYFQVEKIYDSISKDFKYYDYNHIFVKNVMVRLKRCLSGKETFHLFKSLDIVDINKFQRDLGFDNKLYILRNEVIHIPKGMIDNLRIINACIGNVYGYTYSEDLKEEDNDWISNSEMIKLDSLIDDNCTMFLYGASGSLSKWELSDLTEKIKNIPKPDFCQYFQGILQRLYKKKVIMLGIYGG